MTWVVARALFCVSFLRCDFYTGLQWTNHFSLNWTFNKCFINPVSKHHTKSWAPSTSNFHRSTAYLFSTDQHSLQNPVGFAVAVRKVWKRRVMFASFLAHLLRPRGKRTHGNLASIATPARWTNCTHDAPCQGGISLREDER